MRVAATVVAVLLLCGVAVAKDKHSYESGVLLEMESVPCGFDQKEGFTGAVLGTESKRTKEMLCPEYVLETERVIYRIRPKDEKNPALLPLGDVVQFRIHKDKMKLRVPEADNKEREYFVVSMKLRAGARNSRSEAAQAAKP